MIVAIVNQKGGVGKTTVTLGLASIGLFSWSMVPGYIIAQLIGAFLGAVLVYLGYKQHLDETEDPALKLAAFSTGPAIRNRGWNMMTEIIATAMLLFGLLGIIKTFSLNEGAGAIAPFVIGFLIFAIGLSLGGATGFAINPARDLGARIAHALLPIKGKGPSDWGYGLVVPVIGPIIGGILGALLWSLVDKIWTMG